MSGSPLNKFLFKPVLLAAAVLSVLSLPVAIFGSQPVSIRIQGEQWMDGEVKDLAPPYLGLVGALSLGVGVASLAISGWQDSSHKFAQTQDKVSTLAEGIQAKEKELEDLKLSLSSLAASGLTDFIDEAETPKTFTENVTEKVTENVTDKVIENVTEKVTENVTHKVIENVTETQDKSLEFQPVFETRVTRSNFVEEPSITTPTRSVEDVTQKFASAQTFLGFVRTKPVVTQPIQVSSPKPEQLDQLNTQLQTIMAQMASLQSALDGTQRSGGIEVPVANHPSKQLVKSWSVNG
ncbi:hypothetical protein BJP36_17245 [Moorena producens JHB]|uniref:Uncharacterized protein n=1 Tax=Moorena producens (strain JHB) TaxID=1454205 RepID=A0A1D9G1J7_MOOP1|nr:hypothetical protein [Moorena producens]AOY81395.1 hypothetical protein BJP36_17245 [Moorena producens JHB]